jgi:selenobiotic family peptide radical SAM maturase
MFSASYPSCFSVLGPDLWKSILSSCTELAGPENIPDIMRIQTGELGLPDYLPDLARLESAISEVECLEIRTPVNDISINPTVTLLEVTWKNLPTFLGAKKHGARLIPLAGNEVVIVWKNQKTSQVHVREASKEDLLVLKLLVEGITPKEAAEKEHFPVEVIDNFIEKAKGEGIVLAPPSRIRRDFIYTEDKPFDGNFLSAPTFTLQWHITQDCDLHCRHCYDRSDRTSLDPRLGHRILKDLSVFCENMHVRGQVSFSGGNPLLYPHFGELYHAASEQGFMLAVLGNPAPYKQIEALIDIRKPVFFQVSLEGLEEHNDHIRGTGHFRRTLDFLQVLRDLDIYSMVMLTLTEDNMRQVIPLAEILRDVTDLFTFNRLSSVGEGSALRLPQSDAYKAFIWEYLNAAEHNPVMGLKDNLFNIVLREKGMDPFGGCTGFGCGAAFNFLSVLPDGEVHACRKFPSFIGNIFCQNLSEIYDSSVARRYRSGCLACGGCAIPPVCGGCLAVAHSHGIDPFTAHDPYCFLSHGTRSYSPAG